MENLTINQTVLGNEGTLDDIVFQNKNKAYGAYNLRTGYLKTINRAFYIGTAVFVFGLAVPTLYAKLKPKDKEIIYTLANPENILQPPPETPPLVIPPPPVDIPDVPTTRFLPPEIVVDELIEADELPPTQSELEKAPASIETNVGNPDDLAIVVDETPNIVQTVEIAPIEEPIFTVLEQVAEFPGGLSAMSKFLSKNLKYPATAANAGISGRVFLSFVVNKNGEISDVELTKGIGFGCDEEAMRVVKAMPNWSPGKQSGRAVKSRFNLPIVFALE